MTKCIKPFDLDFYINKTDKDMNIIPLPWRQTTIETIKEINEVVCKHGYPVYVYKIYNLSQHTYILIWLSENRIKCIKIKSLFLFYSMDDVVKFKLVWGHI